MYVAYIYIYTHVYTHTSCAVHNLDTLRGYLHCDWELGGGRHSLDPKDTIMYNYIFHLSMYRIFHLLVPSLFVLSNDSGCIL